MRAIETKSTNSVDSLREPVRTANVATNGDKNGATLVTKTWRLSFRDKWRALFFGKIYAHAVVSIDGVGIIASTEDIV